MTDDPLTRLREQLVGAAERRAEERAAVGAPHRANGPRRRRGAWLTLAALLIGVPAAATAAGLVQFGDGDETQGRRIALQAVRDTAAVPACTPVRVASRTFVDGEPLPEITALLPSLRVPVPRANRVRAIAQLPAFGRGGAVLRGTVRTFTLPQGIRLTVWVQQGDAGGGVRDPAACGQARRERAELLLTDHSDGVRRAAQQHLSERRDSEPRVQTLFESVQLKGRFSRSGSGSPVLPGTPLRPGLLSGGGGGAHRSVYVGLAGPRTAWIAVRVARGGHVAGVPARVPVRQGFYAFTLPRGTGPVSLRETSAAGTVLRVIRLRG